MYMGAPMCVIHMSLTGFNTRTLPLLGFGGGCIKGIGSCMT